MQLVVDSRVWQKIWQKISYLSTPKFLYCFLKSISSRYHKRTLSIFMHWNHPLSFLIPKSNDSLSTEPATYFRSRFTIICLPLTSLAQNVLSNTSTSALLTFNFTTPSSKTPVLYRHATISGLECLCYRLHWK